VESTLRSN